MARILSMTALAAVLALGSHGLAGAQGQGVQGQGAGQAGGASVMPPPGALVPPSGAVGTTARAQRAQPEPMGEEQIRDALRANGYSDIQDLEREGDHFRLGEAKRFGEEVSDLRIDARTGQVLDEPRLSEAQAKNLLESRGYSEVGDVSREGDTITAKAKQAGEEVRVRVDARTGMVTRQQAMN